MTRQEDVWHCYECGDEQGRHDMWFEGDICGKCHNPRNIIKQIKFKAMETIWDFVEQYYPNYSSSDEIMHNEDLLKLLEGQVDTGADSVYNEIREELLIFDIEPREEEILGLAQQRYSESLASIYGQAIQGYLETLKD
jgi:hypothetical protein